MGLEESIRLAGRRCSSRLRGKVDEACSVRGIVEFYQALACWLHLQVREHDDCESGIFSSVLIGAAKTCIPSRTFPSLFVACLAILFTSSGIADLASPETRTTLRVS